MKYIKRSIFITFCLTFLNAESQRFEPFLIASNSSSLEIAQTMLTQSREKILVSNTSERTKDFTKLVLDLVEEQ